jgi:hypothetical protein
VQCTFAQNGLDAGGAALVAELSDVTIESCTFWNNWAGCEVRLLTIVVMRNSIVSHSQAGEAIKTDPYGGIELECCDLYGNAGGDWIGSIAGQLDQSGNICADPLYCHAAGGDWCLQSGSPCAPFSPPNPECELIGAWPVGCGGTPVAPMTWGAIKALFLRPPARPIR